MRILFFTPGIEDYLSDSLFHGLRLLLGAGVVDAPKLDWLYQGHAEANTGRLYGRGFTLYGGLLEDIEVDRSNIKQRLRAGEFDLVIFPDIWRLHETFREFHRFLDPARTVVMDGADVPQVYPYAGRWWRRPSKWAVPRAHRRFLYFKREWTPNSQFSLWHRLVPSELRHVIPYAKNLRQTAFSIPEQKVQSQRPVKTKDFPAHVVDTELVKELPASQTSYAFSSEADYYADLQSSRFGITTKRRGWDCMRHYEIAANAAVPCFRDLDRKPVTCAPHGLDQTNSINYRDPADLFRKIAALRDDEYERLQAGAMRWAQANTTRARAKEFLTGLSLYPP